MKSIILFILALITAGCGSSVKQGYTNPAAPIAGVRRIAILPFEGVSEADTVGDIVGMVLANRGAYTIVDRTQILSLINEHRLPAELLDETTVIQKRKLINADALLSGRVTQFQQGVPAVPIATPTRITMSLKLVSAETGNTIWTQVYARSSAGRGLLAPNVDKLMMEMAEEIARDLANLK